MKIEQAAIDQVKLENPDKELHKITSKGNEIIVRCPTQPEYQRFVQLAGEPKTKYAALAGLVRSCTIHPKGSELEKLISIQPGVVVTFANKLLEIAGVEEEAEAEKL